MICTHILADSVKENSPIFFEFIEPEANGAVVVTKVDGKLIAFSAKCPHAGGDFREGEIHRGHAYCPVHQWKFNLVSGRCVGDENYRIKKYPISVVEGLIYLEK
ncbi:MAG: nitrite reductase/ring-hydroxylating ferredoxin subunit [Cellvibrionaceae bacterium]|jgi:nitrite reductase/ring-hydroxylating ferredoxin subunit